LLYEPFGNKYFVLRLELDYIDCVIESWQAEWQFT